MSIADLPPPVGYVLGGGATRSFLDRLHVNGAGRYGSP
jgi:hypothetical protein